MPDTVRLFRPSDGKELVLAASLKGMIAKRLAGDWVILGLNEPPSDAALVSVATPEPEPDRPLVSVIMPAWNAQKYIADAIGSMQAQTLTDWELCIVDDGSDDDTLSDLYGYATELGMQALVEIYEPENLDRVLKLEPPLLGINNLNLRTFETDLEHTIRLQNRIDRNVLLVSESGIRQRADVERLRNAGVGAILVGETLMRSDDIGAKADELMGTQ